jgi:hypothetical protein
MSRRTSWRAVVRATLVPSPGKAPEPVEGSRRPQNRLIFGSAQQGQTTLDNPSRSRRTKFRLDGVQKWPIAPLISQVIFLGALGRLGERERVAFDAITLGHPSSVVSVVGKKRTSRRPVDGVETRRSKIEEGVVFLRAFPFKFCVRFYPTLDIAAFRY